MARRRRRDLWMWLAVGLSAAILTPFLVEILDPEGFTDAAPRSAPASLPVASPSPAPPPPPPQSGPLTVTRAVGELPPITLKPPYEIGEALTIMTEGARVRLAGLDAPAREAACFDKDGNLWACGLQARAALNNLIRQKEVSCRPTGDRTAAGVPAAHCQVGSQRLDRGLVALGFARPLGDDPNLQRDMAEAKAAGRGLWNGGWRIRP